MGKAVRKKRCRHCKDLFYPDPRNDGRQKFCSRPECRKASKAESQRRWLNKPENRNYFRNPENVARVQQWRREHPGYWRGSFKENALQDSLSPDIKQNQIFTVKLAPGALQDVLLEQRAVLIGLIAQLTGNALQDDIAMTTRHLREFGNDFLENPVFLKGGSHDQKTSHLSRSYP
jgi:hypothetical protein